MTRPTLAAALGLALVLSLSGPTLVSGQEAPVNINTATAAQLEELPGIGPATAQAIIEARPFQSVDDLERVKGIGAARVATLRDRVTVTAAATTTTTTKAAAPRAAMPKEETRVAAPAPAGAINLNTATLAQLEELPGIGPAIAQDIIEARPFQSVEDLERVKGIGAARVAALRDLVTVGGRTTTTTATKAETPRPAMPRETAPTTAAATAGAINLNTATPAQLEELPGVGPAIARAIIDARPFRSVDDLENVRGLGPARVAAMRDLVTVTGPTGTTTTTSPRTTNASPLPGPRPTAGGAMSKNEAPPAAPATATAARKATRPRATLPEGTRINVNTASREELERLPLIGPVKAQAIIDSRPFKTVDSLKEVKGIGDVTLERIRPYVVLED